MLRAFSLRPVQLPSAALGSVSALQPVFNKLYVAVGRDVEFLIDTLSRFAARCAWSASELHTLRGVHASAHDKPTLLLPNSVYLSPGDAENWPARQVLSVGNVQAGEPYQLSLVQTFQAAEATRLQHGPLRSVCRAIAQAARLVHSSKPCVAILSKPIDRLALRTRVDARGVGELLAREFGVHTVLYVSMRDLARATLDSTGDLLLDGHRISVVYVRYDFSHPFGRLAEHLPEAEDTAELMQEWPTVQRLEASNAVMSSSLGSRLAHRRQVQHALSRPGGVERFLDPHEWAAIRAVLPEQWCLAHSDERREALELLEADPEALVAKNALRPRTGSGSTQDRIDSGGQLISAQEQVRALLSDTERSQWYICYRRIRPHVHDAQIVHGGRVHEIHAQTGSEIATFGAYLSDATGRVLINELAGMGARVRPTCTDHPLSTALGYGALSCVEELPANCGENYRLAVC